MIQSVLKKHWKFVETSFDIKIFFSLAAIFRDFISLSPFLDINKK